MGNENRAKSKSEPKNDLTTTSNILIREKKWIYSKAPKIYMRENDENM